jgi:hypothetical protein
VSYALAERSLGGAEAAVGRSITLDGVSHVVVGVLPRNVTELAGIRASAWPALQLQAPTRRGPFWLRGIGRLRAGVTVETATSDLAGISGRVFPTWASSFRDQSARLTPVSLRRTIVGDTGQGLTLFAGAVLVPYRHRHVATDAGEMAGNWQCARLDAGLAMAGCLIKTSLTLWQAAKLITAWATQLLVQSCRLPNGGWD